MRNRAGSVSRAFTQPLVFAVGAAARVVRRISDRERATWALAPAAVLLAGVTASLSQPVGWMPPVGETRSLLLGLLAAQAAITALTLAVALFVLQGVAGRRDADERISREYVRRSSVPWIFPLSIVSVAATGAALLAQEFGTAGMPVLRNAPGLPNLTLVGASAFMATLGLS